MKILCAFGRYNYGDSSRGESPEYASFIPAFINLGHDVKHFETWDRSAYKDLANLNVALIEEVDAFKPDIFFSVQMNYEIWLETLYILKARCDLATISWATDDSWKYKQVSRFIGHGYDAMATTYDYIVDLYKADCIEHVILTQWAANSNKLQAPNSARKCKYLVSFIGSAYGSRRKLVNALRARGIQVICFGYGWPNGPVDADKIAQIVRDSVISLNFANSYGENQIKARVFEVTGAGGFLMTEFAKAIDLFFEPGKEIIVYHSFNDLVTKINYFLSHHEERDAIAKAGFIRTVRDHTYEIRLAALIEHTLRAKKNRVSDSAPLPIHDLVSHYSIGPFLKLVRYILTFLGKLLFGSHRGPRAARRLIYELSWRLCGHHTYTVRGLPGRMYPHD
jgi:spore maturation protein CgeB